VLEVPSSALIAGLQAGVVSAVFLTLGYLVSDALLGRRVDAITHWGLAFVGMCLFSLALMLVHIVTGGWVFASPWAAPVVTAVVFLGLAGRKVITLRSAGWPRPSGEALIALGLVVVALLVWCSPVVRSLPLDSDGDVYLHTGWTSQLLNGETTPSAAITGEIPNFYPWLGHSLMAMLARSLPDGRAYHAMAPLQLLQVVGIVLGLFALGRAITGKTVTGAAAALFGAMTGGFGFIALRSLDLVIPREDEALRYFGDLFHRRSYNGSFSQLPPAWPRDVALTLVIGFLLLAVLGLKSRSKPLLAASGVTLGLTALTGAESFYMGLAVALLLCLLPTSMPRRQRAGFILVPALAVAALWLGPLLSTLGRFGFQNITYVQPVSLPAAAVLGSWGIVTPFAVWGLLRWSSRARSEPAILVVACWTLVSGLAVLAFAVLPSALGEALDAIGRPHRYWPLLYTGMALFAALAMTDLLAPGARRKWLPVGVATATVVIALISPTLGSIAFPRVRPEPPLLAGALRGKDGFLNSVAPKSGGRCVMALPARYPEDDLAWSYSGYRFVFHQTMNARGDNPARVRWDGIYEATTSVNERRRDSNILGLAQTNMRTWQSKVDKYGVDVVGVPLEAAGSSALAGLHPMYPDDLPLAVFRLSDCGT
jgi:hypothetical protein